MQRYNMPMQLSNRAHEVKVWEAETLSKCNNTEQLITLIQPQKSVLEVKGAPWIIIQLSMLPAVGIR
jgi:hypothetical protein